MLFPLYRALAFNRDEIFHLRGEAVIGTEKKDGRARRNIVEKP